MPVTASGPISIPVDRLRNIIKDSASFRTWTGTATAVLAKARAYPFAKPRSGVVWPHVVVGYLHRGWSTSIPMREYVREVNLFASFEAILLAADDQDATYTFMNAIGPVITDMWINAGDGTEDRLDVQEISLIDGPMWENEDLRAGEGEVMWCRFMIRAGTP